MSEKGTTTTHDFIWEFPLGGQKLRIKFLLNANNSPGGSEKANYYESNNSNNAYACFKLAMAMCPKR